MTLYISTLDQVAWGNGLFPWQHQVINWTNAHLSSIIRLLEIYFNEILIEIMKNSKTKSPGCIALTYIINSLLEASQESVIIP